MTSDRPTLPQEDAPLITADEAMDGFVRGLGWIVLVLVVAAILLPLYYGSRA